MDQGVVPHSNEGILAKITQRRRNRHCLRSGETGPRTPLPSGRGVLHHPIKARAPAGVAAAAVAGDADLEEQGVLVAVDAASRRRAGSGRSSRPCARARRASATSTRPRRSRASAPAPRRSCARPSAPRRCRRRPRRGDEAVGPKRGASRALPRARACERPRERRGGASSGGPKHDARLGAGVRARFDRGADVKPCRRARASGTGPARPGRP